MADSVTISLLPVTLSLVHIPRSRIQSLFHPILRQLLLPSPTFLNVTCNEIELSLFAEHAALKDFEPLASKDARRRGSGRERTFVEKDILKKSLDWEEWSPVEVSEDRWNVLQIDSHSDGLDNSGARVHELSAPLAAAGISILYQSSYMSDFIFVKEHRLSEVMSLLGSAGFDLYSSDPEHLTNQLSALASPILSPLSAALDDDSSIHLLDLTASGNPISSENGAVLTRSRSSTDANVSAPALRVPIALDTTTSSAETTHQTDTDPVKPTLYRSQSHSPSGCDVHILEPDLTCIGLSDENAELWGLKIVKLVAFPDLVPGTPSFLNARRPSMETPDIASVTILGVDIDSPTDLSCSLDSGEQYDSESDTVSSRSDDITRVGDSPIDEGLHDSSESPVFNMEESPAWEGDDQGGPLGPDEYIDHDAHVDVGKRTARPSLRHLFTDRTYRQDLPKPRIRERSASQVTLPPSPLVPFFSFTRTLEGSSLTGPVALLASLFPPNERHMVMCSGELDVLDSRAASPTNHARDVVEDQDYASGDEQVEPQGTSKCLQIDLRKFGLDKHGLVSRYSRTLEENGINHMYSSTFKTANLLVDKAHARRAQALLRSC